MGYSAVRARRVAEALAEVPVAALDVVEASDPQFQAVGRLLRVHGLGPAAALVAANALVSYRLTSTGEEYWTEFAGYMASRGSPRSGAEAVRLMEEFLRGSRGNRRLLEQKLNRLRRAAPLLDRLLRSPLDYLDLRRLVREAASVLGARGDEKTIVFAAKMLHYLYRAAGLEPRGGEEIPPPIDRRMALLTSTSRLVEASPSEIMTRRRRDAVAAWLEVARLSGIPALRIDAVVWLPAQRIEQLIRRGLDVAREEYARRLVAYTRGLVRWAAARRVAEEILYLPPL